jgi:hypothetical protein
MSLYTGSKVILSELPPKLLSGLPPEDQAAIRSIIGQPVTLVGYSFGEAELELIDNAGAYHTIWVHLGSSRLG